MVAKYTGLNFWEVEELDLDVYLFMARESVIYFNSQTESGREYLENCWRMTQTKPDRQQLREKFGKKGGENKWQEAKSPELQSKSAEILRS